MAAVAPTPRATKVALVGTLAVTATVVAVVLAGAAGSARASGSVLALLTALFLLRVAGQVLVLVRAPSWLPPMGQWNLLPYRFLLPIQLVFLAVMTWLAASLGAGAGPAASRSGTLGEVLVGLSVLYAAAMAVRYVVRMRRRPGERWFGGTIPIVFHVVLATFLLTLGTYHAAG